MLTATADTTGRKRGKIIPVVTTMTPGPPLANTMMKEMIMMNKGWSCEECAHSTQESLDDVACCNCCEDGNFFETFRDEYTLADLGWNWW